MTLIIDILIKTNTNQLVEFQHIDSYKRHDFSSIILIFLDRTFTEAFPTKIFCHCFDKCLCA